jgi:rhamnogalacturonyl hydrolase YesR
MQRYSWEQGVTAQAFLELGETEAVVLLAGEAVTRQSADGRLGMIGDGAAVTDPAANGEALLYAARVTGDRQLEAAAAKMLDWLLHRAPRAGNGAILHRLDRPQVWVDSLYMGPPFLAAAGHYREAVDQIELYCGLLYDPAKRLFAHIWDDGLKRLARKDCWGVGNGWALAGMTRVARMLPPEHAAAKERLIGLIRATVAGCLARQRPDGLFHDVLDDPESFVETNLAQMLAYVLYRGLAEGWFDPSFQERAERLRRVVGAKVDRWGRVQGVCGAPHFDRPGTAPEGQAFYLLMEAAARDWSASQARRPAEPTGKAHGDGPISPRG